MAADDIGNPLDSNDTLPDDPTNGLDIQDFEIIKNKGEGNNPTPSLNDISKSNIHDNKNQPQYNSIVAVEITEVLGDGHYKAQELEYDASSSEWVQNPYARNFDSEQGSSSENTLQILHTNQVLYKGDRTIAIKTVRGFKAWGVLGFKESKPEEGEADQYLAKLISEVDTSGCCTGRYTAVQVVMEGCDFVIPNNPITWGQTIGQLPLDVNEDGNEQIPKDGDKLNGGVFVLAGNGNGAGGEPDGTEGQTGNNILKRPIYEIKDSNGNVVGHQVGGLPQGPEIPPGPDFPPLPDFKPPPDGGEAPIGEEPIDPLAGNPNNKLQKGFLQHIRFLSGIPSGTIVEVSDYNGFWAFEHDEERYFLLGTDNMDGTYTGTEVFYETNNDPASSVCNDSISSVPNVCPRVSLDSYTTINTPNNMYGLGGQVVKARLVMDASNNPLWMAEAPQSFTTIVKLELDNNDGPFYKGSQDDGLGTMVWESGCLIEEVNGVNGLNGLRVPVTIIGDINGPAKSYCSATRASSTIVKQLGLPAGVPATGLPVGVNKPDVGIPLAPTNLIRAIKGTGDVSVKTQGEEILVHVDVDSIIKTRDPDPSEHTIVTGDNGNIRVGHVPGTNTYDVRHKGLTGVDKELLLEDCAGNRIQFFRDANGHCDWQIAGVCADSPPPPPVIEEDPYEEDEYPDTCTMDCYVSQTVNISDGQGIDIAITMTNGIDPCPELVGATVQVSSDIWLFKTEGSDILVGSTQVTFKLVDDTAVAIFTIYPQVEGPDCTQLTMYILETKQQCQQVICTSGTLPPVYPPEDVHEIELSKDNACIGEALIGILSYEGRPSAIFSVTGGEDSDVFTVDNGNELKTVATVEDVYAIQITVIDGAFSDTETFYITITECGDVYQYTSCNTSSYGYNLCE